VLLAGLAELLKFELIGILLLVLRGRIIPVFAFCAL
jgi:hypothetical protein